MLSRRVTTSKEKDQYSLLVPASDMQISHSDWERVIIIHSKNSNNMWAPSRALLSSHSGYHDLAWGNIQNTLTTQQIQQGDAKDPNGVQNNDHPKVYVSWSKHANFDTRNTGWNDPVSQSTDNAFRSDDWWYYVDKTYYVRRYLAEYIQLSTNISVADSIRRLDTSWPGSGKCELGRCYQ